MRYVLHIMVYCMLSRAASGQEISFQARVNRSSVPVGSTFKLTYELNSTNGRFEYPEFSGNVQVVSGPNKSTSMQIINGSMSSSMSISYILTPLKEGVIKLPSAKVHMGNATYETKRVSITATKGNAPAQRENQSAQYQDNVSNIGGKNVFVRLITDRNTAYMGEPIRATYKLYWLANEVQIMDYNFDQLPAPKGFWSEEVKLNTNAHPQLEIIDGRRYNTYVMKKVILFPQYSGNLTIDPFSFHLMLRIADRSRPRTIWDQLMGRYRDIKKSVKSNTAIVTIKPFPTKNKPSGFNNLCGSFRMHCEVPDSIIKTDEAFSVKLKISGSGNLKLLSPPEIAFPPDFEVYDPEVTRNINVNGSGVSGTVTFEYLFIPRVSGNFVIPAVDIPYFAPESGSYKHLIMDETKLTVVGNKSQEASAGLQAPVKHEIKALGTDIRHIVTKNRIDRPRKMRWFGIGHLAGMCLPLLLLAIYFPLRKRVRERLSDAAGRRRRKADKVASSRLKQAGLFMKKGNHDKVNDAINEAIMGYLQDKLQIPLAELNRNTINEKLKDHSVPEDHIEMVENILDDCESARYSPEKTDNSKKLFDQATSTITRLEKIL